LIRIGALIVIVSLLGCGVAKAPPNLPDQEDSAIPTLEKPNPDEPPRPAQRFFQLAVAGDSIRFGDSSGNSCDDPIVVENASSRRNLDWATEAWLEATYPDHELLERRDLPGTPPDRVLQRNSIRTIDGIELIVCFDVTWFDG